MTIQQQIETKLLTLSPSHLEVENESSKHSVPPGSESHFKVTIVTDQFDSMPLIERHRWINDLLCEELHGPLHALSIHVYTESDWQRRLGKAPITPPCLSGSKES